MDCIGLVEAQMPTNIPDPGRRPMGGKISGLTTLFALWFVLLAAVRIFEIRTLRRKGLRPGSSLALGAQGGSPDRSTLSTAGERRDRGRAAEEPSQIPKAGWKDIVIRTWKKVGDDQIAMIAAGVTFYTLLAIFPGIAAFVALYGLMADVSDAQRHLQMLSVILPSGVISLVGDQMIRAAQSKAGGLSLAALGGLALSIWSANGAMKAIIIGLNVAYDEHEKRGFIQKTVTSLGFTLGFLALILGVIGVLATQTGMEATRGHGAAMAFAAAAWPLVLLAITGGLALLYRYGPSRDHVQWGWISWGSVIVALGWVAASFLFSAYVANFGRFDKTYGPLGAVIGFMTWTWISSLVVLLGAELNAEIEHQTAMDTTTGAPQPLGLRGAVMADTIGEAQ
jgi:membrane protein